MVKFKDFSRPLTVFQVLIKANFIFKDFSRQSCKFEYFSSLNEPYIPNIQAISLMVSDKKIFFMLSLYRTM